MDTEMKNLVRLARQYAFDLNFTVAKKWKKQDPSRLIIGHLPIYFPREVIHAAGGMPVGILGTGDHKQIIKGDAYYQSYICHIPRGIIELALDGNLSEFDGFIFPSICDVMRNLSGMFQLLGKGRFAKYFDFPQNFQSNIGGEFYRKELEAVLSEMKQINGRDTTADALNHSIGLFNKNRQMLVELYNIRQDYPWRLPYEDVYSISRAGLMMPIEEHNDMLEQTLEYVRQDVGEPMDKIKVVVTGAFCEQPPLGLIRSIENAGCYVIDDDLLLGMRWIDGNIADDTDNPLDAIVEAYLTRSVFSSSVYDVGNWKELQLVELAKKRKADGVLFAAPSFCDPAMLDSPQLQKACDKAGIRHIAFQYSENTGQFKVIKEQVGAFSDSIKLWEVV